MNERDKKWQSGQWGEHKNKDEQDKMIPVYGEFHAIENLSLSLCQCQCLQQLSWLCRSNSTIISQHDS